ncbi:uncharacterized protein LOC131258217 [Magnolia sinica]|uniref:uncharacterized protein LOC131258217 n=1 Tax=Magnolia sinica TaxID=86752 RepID=UPI002659117A|nr:uncharacterized protein LOC131258217 [Magnolia sinica]
MNHLHFFPSYYVLQSVGFTGAPLFVIALTWDQVADRDLVEKATSEASRLMKRSNAEKFTAREDDGIERFVELNDDADFGSRKSPSSFVLDKHGVTLSCKCSATEDGGKLST